MWELIFLIIIIVVAILIAFLPALWELKKQKDAGPRLILDDLPEGVIYIKNLFESKKKEVKHNGKIRENNREN